jgi:YggT family protein
LNSGTNLLNTLLLVLSVGILGRCVISFVDPMTRNSISRVIFDLTEPIVGPIRRLVPPLGGTLDLSPMIALVLLQVLRAIVSRGT